MAFLPISQLARKGANKEHSLNATQVIRADQRKITHFLGRDPSTKAWGSPAARNEGGELLQQRHINRVYILSLSKSPGKCAIRGESHGTTNRRSAWQATSDRFLSRRIALQFLGCSTCVGGCSGYATFARRVILRFMRSINFRLTVHRRPGNPKSCPDT